MASRRIAIDDSDPSIDYVGPGWSTTRGNDTIGNHGPTYQGFQHYTTGNDSFSFRFSGTSIEAFGTNGQVATGRKDQFDPFWACQVDGKGIRSGVGSPNIGNSLQLCLAEVLDDGSHELVVNVTTMGQAFFLDRILYTPSMKSPGKTPALWVGSNDPDFVYGPSPWNWTLASNTMLTAIHGATVSYSFVGTRLTWTGAIPGDFGSNPTTCNYTVDGGTPVSVNLVGHPNDNVTRYDQTLFTVEELAPVSHTIKVTYLGDNGFAPLAVTYVYVENASFEPLANPTPPPTLQGSSPPPQSTSQPVASGSGGHSKIGAVVGGVVGGLSLALLLVLLFFFRRRQRRSSRRSESAALYWTTFLSHHQNSDTDKSYPIIVTTTTTVTTDKGHDRRGNARYSEIANLDVTDSTRASLDGSERRAGSKGGDSKYYFAR